MWLESERGQSESHFFPLFLCTVCTYSSCALKHFVRNRKSIYRVWNSVTLLSSTEGALEPQHRQEGLWSIKPQTRGNLTVCNMQGWREDSERAEETDVGAGSNPGPFEHQVGCDYLYRSMAV